MTIFSARDITKRYGATLALDRVDFQVHAGAVNVLIGENGAGKSTLMRILAGIETPNAGQLILDDKEIDFSSVNEATASGVTIVHQELSLCPNLTVSDNIFLGRNPTNNGLIDGKTEYQRTSELLALFNQTFAPDTLVSELRIGQQQIVEIARALLDDARILILDEPTSALSPSEVDTLFKLIADLKQRNVAIIYISHRLEELMRIGDYISVLRDGRMRATAAAEDASIDWIIEHMLGTSNKQKTRISRTAEGPCVLKLNRLEVIRQGGGRLVNNVSTSFRAGEITAIYGLLGSGRTELLEAIAGVRRKTQGTIELQGEDIQKLSVAQRIRKGVFLVSEDRQREGIFPNLSVGANLGMAYLRNFTRLGFIQPKQEQAQLLSLSQRMQVKASGLDASITSLSGGNQQKVVLGRCVMADPSLLLIDEPSRGVDIGAREEIFERIRDLADSGTAVVFTTSDLHESLLIPDRIIVMAGGQISADLRAADTVEADLVRACNVTTA